MTAWPWTDSADFGTPDSSPLLAGLRSGAWLDVQDFPPLCYAVPGIIPEGSVLLVGPPKIGKSWLVLTVALAASDGGKALGLDIPKRPTLYLALEDGDRRMQDRCRRLLHSQPIPRSFQYLTRVDHGRVLDTVAAWLDLQADPALVILDTLGKVMPPALNGEPPTSATTGSAATSSSSPTTTPAQPSWSTTTTAKPTPTTSSTASPAPTAWPAPPTPSSSSPAPASRTTGSSASPAATSPKASTRCGSRTATTGPSTATAWPPRPPPPSRRAPPLGSGPALPTSSRPSPSSARHPPPTSPTCSAWNRSASAPTSAASSTAAA